MKTQENRGSVSKGIVSMKMEAYKYKVINFLTRKGEASKAEPPLDLKEAFSKFSGGGTHMSKDQLLQFMVEYQEEKSCSLIELEQIVEKVLQLGSSSTLDVFREQGLCLNDFFNFLLLDDFNGPLKNEVHHDMSAPLSHYFMYTGHNSYLTGNQFTSESSDEPIIEALQQGVRVIELDLWPSKDGIKVVHGRTLTTPVSLNKCLQSIKEHAFVKSDFPVILTLEDHLTSKHQATFAEMATKIFGEMLYCPQTDCLTEFPSPESLKNRIIISTKPPKEDLKSDSINNSELNGSESSEEESPRQELLDSMDKLKTRDSNVSDEDEKDINANDNKPNQQGERQYKHLITIHGGKSKGSMKDVLKVDTKVRRLSLSEKKLKSASESHGADLVRFTQKNILRVYPKGERVQSSNFRPHLGWMYGAQMVAFNMQLWVNMDKIKMAQKTSGTSYFSEVAGSQYFNVAMHHGSIRKQSLCINIGGHGNSLRLMQGMFRANGGCGYVKKPDFLMQKLPHEEEFDPKRKLPVKQILKVKVYKGDGWRSDFSATHFDLFSPPDFYTKVCIVGVPADSGKEKTSVKMDTWYPVWDEEFEFPLTVPELALLRIQVNDEDQGKDDFAGQTCLPVSELRRGFRSVPLYDRKGKKFKHVKLLMRFQFETK